MNKGLLKVAFLVAAFSPINVQAEIKEVENILSLTRRDDGKFDAKCSDGRTDLVTADQIRRNDVCHIIRVGGGNYTVANGGTGNGTVFCPLDVETVYDVDVLKTVSATFSAPCAGPAISFDCELYHCKGAVESDEYALVALTNETFSFARTSDGRSATYKFATPSASQIVGNWTLGYSWGCSSSYNKALFVVNADHTALVEGYTVAWTYNKPTLNWVYSNSTSYTGQLQNDGSFQGTMKGTTGDTGCWTLTRAPAVVEEHSNNSTKDSSDKN